MGEGGMGGGVGGRFDMLKNIERTVETKFKTISIYSARLVFCWS